MSQNRRFDLGTKVAFAQRYRNNAMSNSMKNEYLSHLYNWNGLIEPKSQKRGVKNFITSFQSLISYQKNINFFDFPPIPISDSELIQNGSHRLAASIANRVEPQFISTNRNVDYDYRYFQSFRSDGRNFSTRSLAKMLYRNVAYLSKKVRIALIFPKALQADGGSQGFKKIKNYSEIIWTSTLKTSPHRLKYLIMNSYPGESWMGLNKDAAGLQAKLNQVLGSEKLARVGVVIFFPNKPSDVTSIKCEIRTKYGFGNDSIHISDGEDDTLSLVNAFTSLLINGNSIDNIKWNTPIIDFLNKRHNEIRELSGQKDRCMVVGSGPIEIFGGRVSNDIDFISCKLDREIKGLNDHNDFEFFFDRPLIDLIDSLENKIFIFGVPVADLKTILHFKINRNLPKDAKDVEWILNL